MLTDGLNAEEIIAMATSRIEPVWNWSLYITNNKDVETLANELGVLTFY